ncbi:MAG TPA: glycosyltransferase, partial [Promineifilum sp.]|nr:glycosyltransferase [Promineifilum sp.]
MKVSVIIPVYNEVATVMPAVQAVLAVKEADEIVLIDDGSTLEIGIGRIPQALVGFLKDKKDLGIHTEMISDDIIELIEA